MSPGRDILARHLNGSSGDVIETVTLTVILLVTYFSKTGPWCLECFLFLVVVVEVVVVVSGKWRQGLLVAFSYYLIAYAHKQARLGWVTLFCLPTLIKSWKEGSESALTTLVGRLFQSLIARMLKALWCTSEWAIDLDTFHLWPLVILVIQARIQGGGIPPFSPN